jgi:hypothetical protein
MVRQLGRLGKRLARPEGNRNRAGCKPQPKGSRKGDFVQRENNITGTDWRKLQQPVNWDEAWRFFPVRNIPLRKASEFPEYWQGATATWAELGSAVSSGLRVALLVERSGLVVLDCDVRFDPPSSGNFTFRQALRYGADDLVRLCREREKELPGTFTVSTPSGGQHLYFRQNPYCPVTSRGHHDGWLIDVKASRNSYVITPPTGGYTVIQDCPAAILPYWLARHIRRMGSSAPCQPGVTGSPLTGNARDGLLRFVAESNMNGSWNNSIYWAAHRLIEAGEELAGTTAALLEAAAPWDEREADKARKTIESAWRNAGKRVTARQG